MTADEWRHYERCVGSDNSEAAWFACSAVDYLLFRAADLQYERGRGELSERKLRLFGCACCRLLWPYMPEAASRTAVVAAEDFADGALSGDELANVWEAAAECRPKGHEHVPAVGDHGREEYIKGAPTRAAESIARADDGWPFRTHIDDIIRATLEAAEYQPFGFSTEGTEANLCELFRDIFGNPFRAVVVLPEWRTDPVLALSRRMYGSRDFSAMPVLADALQDAGCDSPDVLDHCRGPGPHVRGCWVVDLILGKE